MGYELRNPFGRLSEWHAYWTTGCIGVTILNKSEPQKHSDVSYKVSVSYKQYLEKKSKSIFNMTAMVAILIL